MTAQGQGSVGNALLTADELDVIQMAGSIASRLSHIVGEGSTRSGDLAELVHHVHAIQSAVLAQAAARAYPDRFRLLGCSVAPKPSSVRSP